MLLTLLRSVLKAAILLRLLLTRHPAGIGPRAAMVFTLLQVYLNACAVLGDAFQLAVGSRAGSLIALCPERAAFMTSDCAREFKENARNR